MDALVQNIENLVNKRLAEVRSRAERTALGHLAEMFETYLQAFMAVMAKGSDKGHEDEYDVIGKDVQEFVLPAPARYVTPELIGKMENDKYVLHQPFNRQIKKMTQDGLPVKAATVNDWHERTCELIEPLFELQKERVFSSALLAIYQRKWVHRIVYSVSALCLEIYLCQGFVFNTLWNHCFPLNILMNFVLVIAVTYILKVVSNWFAQTFKDADYDWRKMVRL